MKKTIFTTLLMFILTCTSSVNAEEKEIVITIDDFQKKATPIAIVPFVDLGDVKYNHKDWAYLHQTILDDLGLTGWFRLIKEDAFLASAPKEISDFSVSKIPFQKWAVLDAVYLLMGFYKKDGTKVTVNYYLYNVIQRKLIVSQSLHSSNHMGRKTAHRVADRVVEYITGEMGIFETKIVGTYVTYEGGNKIEQIFISEFDGKNIEMKTSGKNKNLSPAWSSDGKKIVFVSDRRGSWELNIIDWIQKKIYPITKLETTIISPTFNPTNDEIVAAMSVKGDTKLFRFSQTGKMLQQLTKGWNSMDIQPSFSPDGTKIAFSSSRSGRPQIYVMDANGNNVKRLTFGEMKDQCPAWSPKGDKIVYASQDADKHMDIFVINADGSGQPQRLTYDSRNNEDPTWSPDGRFIAFSTDRERGKYHVWIMNKDGKNARPLTKGKGEYIIPSWSPRIK
ncbi:MAG: hypothetical protein ABIA04_15120 [Pseudomonadota bacterium]